MAGSSRSAEVDEYIAALPKAVQAILKRVRTTLHKAVPGAEEAIRYGVPTLRVGGKNVVHFAGYAKHVGVYPVPDADADLAARVEPYRASKGTLRFPLDEPIPYDLIGDVATALLARR